MSHQLVGNWTQAGSTSITADKISVVLADPGPGLQRVARMIHMEVKANDEGTGDVTFRIIRGSTAQSWQRTVSAQGKTFDLSAEVFPNVGQSLTLEIERSGMTSAEIRCETATRMAAP